MSEVPTDYQPIGCDIYSEYELAIMHRTHLRLHWRDAAGLHHLALLLPRDLETCQGEEFLHAEDSAGERYRIRLDYILEKHEAESV